MTRIEKLIEKYPQIKFVSRNDTPLGFDAVFLYSPYWPGRYEIVYNSELEEVKLYFVLLHETTHFDRGDTQYNEHNEYEADREALEKMLDYDEVIDYSRDNPMFGDYEVADHFQVSVDQLHQFMGPYIHATTIEITN